MRIIFSFFLLIIFLSSCSVHSKKYGESFVGILPEDQAVASIVRDAVSKLEEIYPPGHTTINLAYPMQEDTFSLLLEGDLRKKGYSISPLASIKLAWSMDLLQDEETIPQNWYLTLTITHKEDPADQDSIILTRLYHADGVPVAGFAECRH